MRRALLVLPLLWLACGPGVRTEEDASTPGTDAGTEDAGTEHDAGPRLDAGLPSDGGEECALTCAGCCTLAGVCLNGTSDNACGHDGALCAACGDSTCSSAGVCMTGQVVTGDNCTAPLVLTPGSDGSGLITVALNTMTDDASLSCSASGRRDAVLAFDVATDNTYVQLDATAHSGSSALPVLSFRDVCDDANREWSCEAATSAAPAASLAASLDRGRYFAWVEANGSGSVDVAFHFTTSGVGDTCQMPNVLTFNGNTAIASDDLSHYTPTNLSCSGGRDAIYSFTLATTAFVTITMTPGGNFTPEIDLPSTSSCSSGQITCNLGTAPGVARSVTQQMAAGTHTFNVTSSDGVGPYDITVVKESSAPADTCGTASTITLTNGHATTSVPLSTLSDDFTAACLGGTTSGKDAIYRFSTTATGDFTARLSGDFSANYDVLSLRSSCTGADIACDHALAIQNLPAGDYYLLVDSLSSVAANVTLDTNVGPPATAGSSCLRPDPLTLSNGTAGGSAHVTGTLQGATNSFAGSCLNSGQGGVDHIYSFTIDQPLILHATAAVSSRSTFAIRVGRSANECTRGASVACNETTGTSVPLTELLQPGSYLLAVEGSIGAYTLDVSLDAPPAGEYCGDAIDVDLSSGTFTDTSTTIGLLQDDNNNACAGYDLPDRVYRIVTTEAFTDLRATITVRNGTRAPALLLDANNCPGLDTVNCQGYGSVATRTIQATSLEAGTYYMWVKGPTTAGADYTLNLTAKPTATGDTCDVAIPLSFTDGAAHASGDTTGLEDDYYACNQISPAFGDAIYSFTTDQEYDFRATMTPTSTTARGALSLMDSSCRIDSSHCATSNNTGSMSLKVGNLPAGDHLMAVDYSSGGPGAYALDATLSPHQSGETCSNPLPVTFTDGAAGGTATLNVDLRDYFHDDRTSCGYTGADFFFSFTIDRALDLRMQATPGTGTGTIEASLVNTCGAGALNCATLYTGSWAQGSLAPGTYVVMVAVERSNEEGPVSLSLSLTPPAPGDTCANALDLGLPSTGGAVDVTGTTANLFDERTGSCAYDTYGDIVYTFTTSRTLSFYATLTTPTNAGSHAMYLRGSNCTGTTDLACSAGNAAQTGVRAADLPAGTYYLIVDRAGYNTPQDFTLHAWAGDRPAGDTCATALPLGLPTSGRGEVTATGNTGAFFQDFTPSCGASTSSTKPAPDVVYSFTTTSVMNLRLYIQATATGFRPTVSLRSSCGTGSDSRCAATPSYATDAWTSYQALPAGTWYVVVDGYDAAQFGPYSLTARLAPNQIPGETCANPAPVTLSSGTTGTATANATFPDYFHDYSDCWASDGADVVYAITTDRTRRLHVRAEPTDRLVQPDVSIRGSACTTQASALVCNRPEYDGTGRASADIPSGTSYVVVKSPLTNPSGSVALNFAVDSFAAGDVCSQALPLTFSNGAAGGTATASGDLFPFGADATLSCGRSGAPDVFYTFTTNRTLNLSVSLTREDSSASFALALTGACGTAEQTCAASSFSSGPITLTKNALPAGTYTLIVQGGAQHPSGWSLSATLGM